MRLIHYHSPGNRTGGACATDMGELDWFNWFMKNYYNDVHITHVTPMSERDFYDWKAAGKLTITFQSIKLGQPNAN